MPNGFQEEIDLANQFNQEQEQQAQDTLAATEPGNVAPSDPAGEEQTVFTQDLIASGQITPGGRPNLLTSINQQAAGEPAPGFNPEEQLKAATGAIREEQQALADFQFNVAVRNQIRQANLARAQAASETAAIQNIQAQTGLGVSSAAAALENRSAFAQGSITAQLEQNLDAFSTSRELGRNVIEAQQALEDLQFDLRAEARQRGEALQLAGIEAQNEQQQFSNTLSLIGTGAAVGGSVGGPVGAVVGAGVGLVAGIFGG